jgi:glycosyltransferase involved in cell wall biosynthesis
VARAGAEISVVIATHNRSELLASALQTLAEQTLARDLFEIVVVDNGSTDETFGKVSDFALAQPKLNVKIVSEPRLGLGLARNTGTEQAAGRLIAFLDDDAEAEAHWLERALRYFAEIEPPPIAVGGPIEPFYLAPKPDWFKDEYEIRSWGDEPRFLNDGESFSGSNMIFEKVALQAHGGFSTALGMTGKRLSVGEETVLFDEIWRRNPRALLYYSPDLVVQHAVPAYKMTVSYCLKRSLVEGQVWYKLHSSRSALGRARDFLFNALPYFLRSLVVSPFRLRRYEHYQNWFYEDFSQVASRLGGLLGPLGVRAWMRRWK